MTTNKKIQFIFGIFVGLTAYAIIGKLGLYLLQVSWTQYALHSLDKLYSVEMLLTRQFIGILASITAGFAATIIASDNGKSAFFVGIIIFCGGSYIHFMTKTWTEYPVWYHFAYVIPILPVIALSSFLISKINLLAVKVNSSTNRNHKNEI
jgi:fructose-specific phosphotransferase system IIC component